VLEAAIIDNPDLGDDLIHLLPAELQARAVTDVDFRRKASRGVLANVKASHSYRQKRIEWASNNNIYLAEFNDRLLLGLKGTMSEAELHLIRARLDGGLRSRPILVGDQLVAHVAARSSRRGRPRRCALQASSSA